MDWNDFVLRFNADFKNEPARLNKKEDNNEWKEELAFIIVVLILFFLCVASIYFSFGAVESGILRNFLISGV